MLGTHLFTGLAMALPWVYSIVEVQIDPAPASTGEIVAEESRKRKAEQSCGTRQPWGLLKFILSESGAGQ
jgi:hypothetical protein